MTSLGLAMRVYNFFKSLQAARKGLLLFPLAKMVLKHVISRSRIVSDTWCTTRTGVVYVTSRMTCDLHRLEIVPSRGLSEEDAVSRVATCALRCKDCTHGSDTIYLKKIDSTLRGWVAAELDATLRCLHMQALITTHWILSPCDVHNHVA